MYNLSYSNAMCSLPDIRINAVHVRKNAKNFVVGVNRVVHTSGMYIPFGTM